MRRFLAVVSGWKASRTAARGTSVRRRKARKRRASGRPSPARLGRRQRLLPPAECGKGAAALGLSFSDLGRREEAVAIRRRLAAARPDAFEPDLAGGPQQPRLTALGPR